MKYTATALTVLLVLFSIPNICFAQSTTWHWSVTAGDALNEYISSADCDEEGNLYVTGNFRGTFNFFGETLTSVGDYDVFIARFDSNGNMIWVTQGGGIFEDGSRDIFVDDEFVYVTGGFVDQVVFEEETLVSEGGRDMFLLKFNLEGALQWAKHGGSVTDDAGNSVTADIDGNVYITGDMNYTATFGDQTVPYFGFTDLFIAKYNVDGNCEWAKSAGGPIYDYGACIETVDGHLFVSGAFNDVAQFDTATVTSVDFVDVFIAHYLTDGSFIEVASAGGTNNENIACMAVDADLNVYLGGWFMLDITIGENSFTSNGGMDIFITKFEPGSGFVWAKTYGGPGIDEPQAMRLGRISGSKNRTGTPLVLTGTFENMVNFGVGDLTSEGFDDGFILQIDENGLEEWAQQIGGSGAVNVHDCAIDKNDRCFFVGDFLDELKIGTKTYNPVGGYDLFIAKLGESLGVGASNEEGLILEIAPNPFTNFTRLSYFLKTESKVSVAIYCQEGKKVKQIINTLQPKGEHTINIDASQLNQGIYQVILKTNQETQSRKLVKVNN